MKKKIINGLLMMALAVSTTSSFVSCTDTNADDIAQIREQMADQSTLEGLQGQVSDLMNLVQRLADVQIGGQNLIDDKTYLEELFKQLQELGVAASQGQSGNVGPKLPDGDNAQNLNDWVKKVTLYMTALNQGINGLQGTVGGIRTDLTGLQGTVSDLQTALAAIKSCTCDLSQYTPLGDFTTLQTAFNTFMSTYQAVDPAAFASNTEFQNLKTLVESINLSQYVTTSDLSQYAKISDLSQYITTSDLSQYAKLADLQALQTQFDNFDLSQYATKAGLQELEGNFNTLKNAFENIDWSLYASAAAQDQLKQQHDALKAAFDAIDFNSYASKETMDSVVTELASITSELNTLKQTQITQGTKLQELQDAITGAQLLIQQNSARIAALEAASASGESSHATKQELADEVARLQEGIATAEQNAKNYTDLWINTLRNELTTKITDLETATNTKFGEIQAMIQDLDTRVTNAEGRLTSAEGRLTSAEGRLDNAEANIQNLAAKQAALENQVNELTKKVEENTKKINGIFSAMTKQVTGIIVQGAYSPVFGIGMLPVNAKTNILAAYYGYTSKAVEFPAKNANNYVDQDEFWKPEEYEFVTNIESYTAGANQLLLSDAEDNAGKLYLTVNPAQVDFTDKIIEIENSQGTAAPIALSPLKKSNQRLSFGWTRSAQNGFYEANAKITAQNLEAAKARIDVDALKEVAKDLYNKHNKASLKDAVQTIISQNGDILDAQAAKATYEGVDEKGNVENKNVLSDYSIATTVIKPLSYNTLRGWNPTSIPGVNKIEDFVSEFFDKIDIKIDLGVNGLVVPEIKEIVVKDFDDLSDEWNIEVIIPAGSVVMTTSGAPVEIHINGEDGKIYAADAYDEEGKLKPGSQPIGYLTLNKTVYSGTITASNNVAITLTPEIKEQLRLVYDAFAVPLNDANASLSTIQDFVNQINDILNNLNDNINSQINDAKNDIKDQLIGYIDKLEKKVLSYASNVNDAMQPVLLVKNGKTFNRVSKYKKRPSKIVSKSAALVPTSYNAELLTPAFKKLVVCTGAWKADGTFDAEEAKAANANNDMLGKVFDGQERLVEFQGKAGYKYRIVYQALDYHGKIASNRYYVQF